MRQIKNSHSTNIERKQNHDLPMQHSKLRSNLLHAWKERKEEKKEASDAKPNFNKIEERKKYIYIYKKNGESF